MAQVTTNTTTDLNLWEQLKSAGSGGGNSAIRDKAKTVARTINAQGSVTQVVYTFVNPAGTITDDATYSGNSALDAVYETFGDFVPAGFVAPPLPPQTLTAFSISSNGTKINYAVTGSPITAITGSLKLSDNSTRALTFVSSSQATIAGAAITTANTGLTVTIASSNPALTTAVTNAAVINNSTIVAVPGATLRDPAWTSLGDATYANNLLSMAGSTRVVRSGYAIDTTQPFEVQITYSAASLKVFTQLCTLAQRSTSGGIGVFPGDATTNIWQFDGFGYNEGASGQINGLPNNPDLTLYYVKSGNDIVVSYSAAGSSTRVLAKTYTGVLTNIPTLYVKSYTYLSEPGSIEIKIYT